MDRFEDLAVEALGEFVWGPASLELSTDLMPIAVEVAAVAVVLGSTVMFGRTVVLG